MVDETKMQVIREAFSERFPILAPYFDDIPRWNPPKPSMIPSGFWSQLSDYGGLRNALGDAGILGAEYGCDRAEFLVRRVGAKRDDFVLIVTDTPEEKKVGERIFPWTDEAELILKLIQQLDVLNNLQDSAKVLDLCTGAGTVALCLKKIRPDLNVVGVDINRRALAAAEFNAELNGLDVTFKYGDLFDQLVDNEKYDLIIVDPPFAMVPPETNEYEHSDGGDYGDEVSRKAIRQSSDHLADGGRLLVLAYSLGGEPEKGKSLPARLRIADAIKAAPVFSKTFDGEQGKTIRHLGDEKIMRFGMEKCTESPMPLLYWSLRACDPAYVSYQRGSKTQKQMVENFRCFRKFLDARLREDYTHLYYLLVDLIYSPTKSTRATRMKDKSPSN